MTNRILIADDEQDIVELLEMYLTNEDFQVVTAYDGQQAWDRFDDEINLAILDIMMPGMDGLALAKRIRKESNIPIIILTARSEDHDKILGLGIGADDYVTKPFSPLEVVARAKAQLRRYTDLNTPQQRINEDKVQVGQVSINPRECIVQVRGEEISLTTMEYKMLKLFMESKGQVFTKKQIYEQVWEEAYFGEDNTIMVHISRLREKIEPDPKKPIYLTTIRGIGYRFEKRVADER